MHVNRIAVAVVLALASAAFIALPVQADPPPWAPAHGWRAHHQYVYYPSAEIYYAPESRMWFWLGGNGWQAGVSLPAALQGYVQVGGVNISLDVDRPYLRNAYVVRRYGGHEHRWRGDGDDQGQDQGGYDRHRQEDYRHGHGHKHDHDHQNGSGH